MSKKYDNNLNEIKDTLAIKTFASNTSSTADYIGNELDQLKLQLAEKEKEKEVKILKAMLETGEYWNKKYDDCQQQLALTEKALKLAREYMFNVMCADDVPFESWFIECAKNDWKPS